MCIIVDANRASEIPTASDDAKPILASILGGGLKIVSGHKLKDELLNCSFRKLYRELQRAGRLIEFPEKMIEAEITRLAVGSLKSNDGHIIALARVSGARILFSADADLHQDFKNPRLVNGPRGRVYQNKDHTALLKGRKVCPC